MYSFRTFASEVIMMSSAVLTVDHVMDLLKSSTTVQEINRLLDEVATLTHTKIRDIQRNMFTAMRLAKAGGNPLMVKVMELAEKRKEEI